MKRILWWCLMYLWCRDATRLYWGPDADGVYFNTACFQRVAHATLGFPPTSQDVRVWLVSHGWYQGIGGCHWFRNAKAANEHYEQCMKQGIGVKSAAAAEENDENDS